MRRAARAAAGLLAFAFGLAARAGGTPDWVQPHLALPSPSGPYLAALDEWVSVYGEVEFSQAGGGRLRQRRRFLLENRTDQPRPFATTLHFDQSRQALDGFALYVEKALLWHEVNLEKSAAEASVDQGEKWVWVTAEKIPAHHRVVLEYTLTDQLDFPPGACLSPVMDFPAARLRVSLADGPVRESHALSLLLPRDVAPPASFRRESAWAWEFVDLPAEGRLKFGLPFQPEPMDLYPLVLVEPSRDPAAAWAGFAERYRTLWDARVATADATAVAARAESLTRGLQGPAEKARALYRFVQHEVRYDDRNSRGLEAWVPLATGDTLRSMRADCKGKVLLLQALLRAVGLESAPLLTARTDRYYAWRENPAAAVMNHVVLAVALPQTGPPLAATLRGGPRDGWLLLDPTLEETGFGAPDPGLEGCPALAVGAPGDPRFTLRTERPSVERTEVAVALRVSGSGDGEWRVKVRTNGGSALLHRLAEAGPDGERERRLGEAISGLLRRPSVSGLSLTRGFDVEGGGTEASWACLAPGALEGVGARNFLTSPLALAALAAGIPNGLPVLRTLSDGERVLLSPPWDRKLCTTGRARVTDVEATVQLPPGHRWAPPPPREETQAAFTYSERWEEEGPGHFRGRVRLEIRRGEWPAEDRPAMLQAVDRLYRGFYAPWVLTTGTAAPDP